ncbi:hypothetical protein JQ604_03560 [Bradyrhizobium jicamae]|uniref:hypothetical protein n=1 Tax=Bradyrhizobium jicamae TaxID=280332 RepID=UPI001BA64CCD|nr:hypothetical protein [Bradyrhizobium jicamae]MBR0751249.1 hypothetical protein [Bradyrhizobium jicamae]
MVRATLAAGTPSTPDSVSITDHEAAAALRLIAGPGAKAEALPWKHARLALISLSDLSNPMLGLLESGARLNVVPLTSATVMLGTTVVAIALLKSFAESFKKGHGGVACGDDRVTAVGAAGYGAARKNSN